LRNMPGLAERSAIISPHSRRKPGPIFATARAADEWVPAFAGNAVEGSPTEGVPQSVAAVGGEWASQRDVVVLLPRVLELLAAQHRQRAAEAPPRRARLDHVVDKAAAGGDERVCEFLAVFLRARLDRGGVGE